MMCRNTNCNYQEQKNLRLLDLCWFFCLDLHFGWVLILNCFLYKSGLEVLYATILIEKCQKSFRKMIFRKFRIFSSICWDIHLWLKYWKTLHWIKCGLNFFYHSNINFSHKFDTILISVHLKLVIWSFIFFRPQFLAIEYVGTKSFSSRAIYHIK